MRLTIGSSIALAALAALAALVVLAACGGGSAPPPAAPEAPSKCQVDPALAETRQPKPKEEGCSDTRGRVDACNGGDAGACYQAAICIKLQELGVEMSAEERAEYQTAILAGLREACDSGIAEACTMRVGMQMMNNEPLPADGCVDIIRGCNLGDEDGCFACRFNCE